MSRTNRKCPVWARDHERRVKSVGFDAVGRNRYVNEYDRRFSKDLYQPHGKSPRGYDTWEHTCSGRKNRRDAKKGVSRLMRIRGHGEIRQALNELHEE